jgi:hypothetical protein
LARLFYLSLFVGILLAVAVAGVFPLPRHERYRATTSVIPDGGRAEGFVIEWPQDRVDVGAVPGLRKAATALVLDGGPGAIAGAEAFRLRDLAGNVVGLATRSTSARTTAAGALTRGSDWVLLLPGRGALFLTQDDSRDMTPRAAGNALVPAADAADFWAGERRLRITAGPEPGGAGRVSGGTAEFSGLRGSYDEVWELDEALPTGGTRGRVTLTTRIEAEQP